MKHQAIKCTKVLGQVRTRRYERALTRIKQKFGHRFKMKMLERARYNRARRLMHAQPETPLKQAYALTFLSDLRKA